MDISKHVYRVTMEDGSQWDIPLAVIANDRAQFYASEFDGDLQRSLDEDTIPMFIADSYNAEDWAKNNMNWVDVQPHATMVRHPDATRFQEGWVNGEAKVITKE